MQTNGEGLKSRSRILLWLHPSMDRLLFYWFQNPLEQIAGSPCRQD